jgi:fatty-acyl-CoA synthase
MRTLVDILRENARLPERAITFVRANGDEVVVPFPEVFRRACQRAEALADLGIVKGDRVALVLPDPEEFVLTFLGALVAGIVAVPIYPPATMAKLDAYGETLRHVLEASGTKLIVASEGLLPMLAKELPAASTSADAGSDALRLLPESAIRGADRQGEDRFAVSPDDLAFLQFTSGSTSRPKGVLVTHGSLAANAHGIMFDGLKARDGDRGVCWLPLYHDMGLIGFVVAPLFAQVEVMFLPTASFVRRPSLWLDAIHRFRGTITFAPNFAYALATRSVQDRQTTDWDLSCLRVLGCGAEPIQASVLSGFVDRFAPQGLRSSSLLPCYGMAEATLAITFHALGEPMRVDRIAVDDLRRGLAVPAAEGARALELVGCGRPFPGHEVAIVGPGDAALGERAIGEIAFRGPSVTKGYFADAEATRASFDTSIAGHGGGWLRTGDLGYLVDGELFVCGREKDLLILNGKNYFPEDIERVAATVEGIREGHIVAFSRLSSSGQERAVIVAEGRKELDDSVENAVIQAVRAHLGLTIDEVRLIKRGTLPKTSSGKVRRKEARRRLEEDLLEVAPPPAPVVIPAASSTAPVPAAKIQLEVEVSHGIE